MATQTTTTTTTALPSSRRLPADPFASVMWKAMADAYFPGDQLVFDSRLKISAPAIAENQFNVPVTVDATGLVTDSQGLPVVIETVVVVADLNPIQHILTFKPKQVQAFLGFRVKLQQATPIHVGVRTADGVWHLAGVYVDAAGGGCTAPAAAHGMANWMQTLGQTRVNATRDATGEARVTLKIRHPMDTGLANGIPAFFMKSLVLQDQQNQVLAELDLYEPISENPTLTLKPIVSNEGAALRIFSHDTEGNHYAFTVDIPRKAAP